MHDLAFKEIKDLSESIISEFRLQDDTNKETTTQSYKLLTISFTEVTKHDLEKLHTYITESAPYEYYGHGFQLVKNYSSQKSYSSEGVEELEYPKQKLLKFFLTDNSYVMFNRNDQELQEKILIKVTSEPEIDHKKKITSFENTILEFIRTF